MTEKWYTWEEKIDNLVRLAKLIGTYLDVEIEDPGSDGHKATREQLKDAYYAFCDWRHEEPYVVDEINGLLERRVYEDITGVRLIIEKDTPRQPDLFPKLTIWCPPQGHLSYEQVNAAIARLFDRAGLPPALLPRVVS